MPKLLRFLLRFYMPGVADGDGGGGGGTDTDRGDDFVPTEDEAEGEGDTTDKKEEATEGEKKEEIDEKKDDEPKDEKKDDKAKPKDTRMPLARHKEVLERERARREAVEQELAKYQKGEQVAKTNEKLTEAEDGILELEKQYAKALSDGEVEKATGLMTQIRRAERGIVEAKGQLETQAAEARAYERVRYDTTLERLEAAFPQINPDDDSFDKAVVAEMIELKDAYQLKGYTPAQALQKAAKLMLRPETKKQEAATETEARVDKEDVAEALAKERRTAAKTKNADVANKQPPSTAKVGLDSDKMGGGITAKDVMKMKQDDFAKLDETTLAKMRGDELV